MNIPKRIIIVAGALKMADGSDLRQYLRDFQAAQKLPDGEYVNVVIHSELERERFARYLAEELALAS